MKQTANLEVVAQEIPEIPSFESLRLDNLNNLNGITKNSQSYVPRSEWKIKASIVAKNTFNPIRNILETMDITPHPKKKMISLSIGDPTVFGNLKPAKEIVEAVKISLESGVNNGYGPSTGFAPARQAVADYVSVPGIIYLHSEIIIIILFWHVMKRKHYRLQMSEKMLDI